MSSFFRCCCCCYWWFPFIVCWTVRDFFSASRFWKKSFLSTLFFMCTAVFLLPFFVITVAHTYVSPNDSLRAKIEEIEGLGVKWIDLGHLAQSSNSVTWLYSEAALATLAPSQSWNGFQWLTSLTNKSNSLSFGSNGSPSGFSPTSQPNEHLHFLDRICSIYLEISDFHSF